MKSFRPLRSPYGGLLKFVLLCVCLPAMARAAAPVATQSNGSNDPPLSVTTSSLPDGTLGTAYNQSLSASGGTGKGYNWSAPSSLPPGLSLSTSGAITGTPAAVGTTSFTVEVKDSAGATASAPLSITIDDPALTITTSSLPAGAVGMAYSQSLSASGGTGKGYNWSVMAGSLPDGLTLSTSGAISGAPNSAGTSNFTAQVKDSGGNPATKALSIVVNNPPLTVTTSSLPDGTLGTAYNQSLSASGGTGKGYNWSAPSSLPPGLSLSTSGAITGTPAAAGTTTFTVEVKDSSSATASASLSIVVNNPPLTITTSSLPGGTVGTAYSQSLSASGGTGKGYTWSIMAGSLPAGLTLSTAGAISGTPGSTGTSNFTAQVKDSGGNPATEALSIVVNDPPLTVTTSSLPGGTVGTAYSQSLSASGGTGKGYNWSAPSSLPPGLTLSTSGAINGTPAAAGTTTFTVEVKDSSGATATASLSITIDNPPLTVTTSSLPAGVVGTAYNQSLPATGGTGTGYTWSTTAGSLPPGLSLSTSGAITGTPTSVGTFNFTVQVKDSAGATATASLSIAINTPPLTVTTSSLPAGAVGTAYNQSLSASGGSGTEYTWSITAGSLPAGLTLSASGTIAGIPTSAATSSFTVQVKDSAGATATASLSIAINTPQLTVTTSSLAAGAVGTAYNQSLSASGGTGSGYSWSITAGSLPAGLTLSVSGSIAGTPTSAGASSFTVQLKDSSGATATVQLSIAIAAPPLTITTTSLPSGSVGAAYSQSLSATGGSGPYSWSIGSGSLPSGLSLNKSGLISGTPTTPGTASFTAAVTDGVSTASRGLTLPVVSVITLSGSLPVAVVGSAYSSGITATGGTAPYNWMVALGALPPGLTLDATAGTISGTPTVTGNYSFILQVTDITTGKTTGNYSIAVNPALTIATASTLTTGSAGAHYSQTFTANGGVPPYGWALSGTLPNGLAFSAGVLSGTPTEVGAYSLTVSVTDATSSKISQTFSLQVVSGLAVATPPVLPEATSGVAYSLALQPVGGTAPYSWVVTAGSLPAGLTFAGSGQIAGTATSIGTFDFTVQVTDANSNTAQKQLTLVVAGPVSIASATLPASVTGAPYSETLTASGGTPPYTWSVSAGSLPPGLSLQTPTGTLSGTPSATGTFTFTVTVIDSNSIAAQKQFQIAISAGLVLTNSGSLPAATAGSAYSFQMQASGGQPPYSWSISQGSLPAGLSLDAALGTISGTPTAAGSFNFTVQVTDSANATAGRSATLQVTLPPLPAISITGLPANLQTLQQPAVSISLASPYPVTITGTVSLTFTPSGANADDDPSVQFSTGGRSATFTIPANTTQATFAASSFAVQAGSVMGAIILTIDSLNAAGASLDVPPATDQTAQTATIAASPPVISSLTLVHTSDGIQLQIDGLTDTRELTQAVVTFQPAPGDVLQNQQVTISLSSIAATWYQSSGSSSYGGQFGLTMPFTFQGTVSLSSVSLVLSNTSGNSTAASANY